MDGDKKQVLVLGGHTGTGSIAIQVAKYFGSNVTCTVKAGSEDWVKRLGADAVSTDGQWWESFKGQGFDAVFDTLGEEEAFEHSKAVLKDKGAFATELPEYLRKNAGLASWAKQGAVTVGRKIASVASVGYHNAWASVKQQDLEALRLLVEGGDFKSVANHYFPLAEALKAFELVRSGDCLGKVVVTIKDDKAADIEREFAVKGIEVAGPAASVARSSSPPAAAVAVASPVKAASTSNDNNVEVARERDLGADDYEEEPAGMANPFH